MHKTEIYYSWINIRDATKYKSKKAFLANICKTLLRIFHINLFGSYIVALQQTVNRMINVVQISPFETYSVTYSI